MLHLVKSMKELDFAALMDVYVAGNRENGFINYPDESESRQLFLAEQDFHQYLRECFFPTEGAFYALWVLSGKYVSALRMEPYRDGLLLAALETMPQYRRRGFATALLQEILGLYGDQKIYSHVHKGNTASRKTHQKCGFRIVLDHAVYADGSVLQNSYTFCFDPKGNRPV